MAISESAKPEPTHAQGDASIPVPLQLQFEPAGWSGDSAITVTYWTVLTTEG